MGKKMGGALGIKYGMYNFKDGMYNFNKDVDINFFADLEGNMPDEIKTLININDNENGAPFKLDKNRAIVFTGDLIDRGKMSIRNLKNMLKLKTDNETHVVLTCGNRDLNKIRCYQEFAVEAIKDILMQKKKDSLGTPAEIFISIINRYNQGHFKFKYPATHIEQYVNLKGIWGKYGQKPDGKPAKPGELLMNFAENYTDDLKKRVAYIYENTFGSPNQVAFFKEEFEELFEIHSYYYKTKNAIIKEEDKAENKLNKEDFYEEYIHVLIITMNMIMGKRWDKDNTSNTSNILIDAFEDYKGLYIRYLEKCHIMSKITIGDKLIITSHSGIPYHDTTGSFIIPREIGKKFDDDLFDKDLFDNINIENIAFLNSELTNFLIDFNKNFNITNRVGSKFLFIENFKKYIAMTGHCLNECSKHIKDEEQKTIKSQLSPIVGSDSLTNKGPLKYREEPIILDCRFNKYKKIYHIFAHQPAGLLPSFSKVENKQSEQITYHIDLDISKAENSGGISNSKSYVYLKITDKEHSFVGKTEANEIKFYDLSKDSEILIEQDTKGTIGKISIPQYNISLDNYGIMYEKYYSSDRKATYDIILHSTDNITYYGMCSQTFGLLKYTQQDDAQAYADFQQEHINVEAAAANYGGGISNKYKKSEKRFINGKRKMVIYTGKRGAEYVKVKGEFISLAKYKKIISKDVKKN